jgi:hypothetical protein
MNNKEFLTNLASLCPKKTNINIREVLEKDTIEPDTTPKKKKTEDNGNSPGTAGQRVLDAVYDNTIGAYVDYFNRTRNTETASDVARQTSLDDAIGRNERVTDQIISQFKAGTISKDEMKKRVKDSVSGLRDVNASLQRDANLEVGEKAANTARDVAVTGLYFTPGGAPIAAGLDVLGAATDAAKASGNLDTYMSPEEASSRAKSQALGAATFGVIKAAPTAINLVSKIPGVKQTATAATETVKQATPEIVKAAGRKVADLASKANAATPYNPAGGAVGAIIGAQTIESDDSFIEALAKVGVGGIVGGKGVGGAVKSMPSLEKTVSFGRTPDRLGRSWERAKEDIADNLIDVPRKVQTALASSALALTPPAVGPVATPAASTLRGTQISSVLGGESRGIGRAAETAPARAAETAPARAAEAPVRAAEAPARATPTFKMPFQTQAPSEVAPDVVQSEIPAQAQVVAPNREQQVPYSDQPISYANRGDSGQSTGEGGGEKGKGEGKRGKGEKGPISYSPAGEEEKVKTNIDLRGGVGLQRTSSQEFGDFDKAVLMQIDQSGSPEQVTGTFYRRNRNMTPTLSTEQFALKNKIKALIEHGRSKD